MDQGLLGAFDAGKHRRRSSNASNMSRTPGSGPRRGKKATQPKKSPELHWQELRNYTRVGVVDSEELVAVSPLAGANKKAAVQMLQVSRNLINEAERAKDKRKSQAVRRKAVRVIQRSWRTAYARGVASQARACAIISCLIPAIRVRVAPRVEALKNIKRFVMTAISTRTVSIQRWTVRAKHLQATLCLAAACRASRAAVYSLWLGREERGVLDSQASLKRTTILRRERESWKLLSTAAARSAQRLHIPLRRHPSLCDGEGQHAPKPPAPSDAAYIIEAHELLYVVKEERISRRSLLTLRGEEMTALYDTYLQSARVFLTSVSYDSVTGFLVEGGDLASAPDVEPEDSCRDLGFSTMFTGGPPPVEQGFAPLRAAVSVLNKADHIFPSYLLTGPFSRPSIGATPTPPLSPCTAYLVW